MSCFSARAAGSSGSQQATSPATERGQGARGSGQAVGGRERGRRGLPDRRRRRGHRPAAAALREIIRTRGPAVRTRSRQAGRRAGGCPCTATTNSTRRSCRERTAEFRDQVAAPPGRRADRGPVQAAAADERPLSAAARLHAADRHPLRHADSAPAAQARRHRRTLRQGLRPLHHPPEHPVQLDQAEGRAGHPGRAGRGRDARHPDLAATASATSPPTTLPAPPPTRSTTRASGPSCSASGRRLHPEFSLLPRKFKIAVTALAARPRRGRGRTTSACGCLRRRRGRDRLRGHGRRRAWAARRDRQDRPRVPAGGRAAPYCEAILRVYNRYGRRDNIYKARIKILVARAGRRGIRAPGRGRVRGRATRPSASTSPPPSSRASQAYFAPPAFETLPAAIRLHSTANGGDPATSPASCATTLRRTSCPATPSSTSR